MTREEAIEVLDKMKYPQKVNKNGFIISNVNIENEALEMAIKALSQEPYICDTCEHKEDSWDTEPCDGCCKNNSGYEPTDAISRDAVWGIIMRSDFVDRFTYLEFTKKLDALPNVTVTPQKSGKWIEKDGFDGDVYYDCSECGESWTTIEGTPWDNEWDYCPSCGAKMVEGSDPE